MSFNRRMKRREEALARKGSTSTIEKQLASALKGLPAPEQREDLRAALDNMSQVTTAVHYLVKDVQGLIYELHKQKMVALRLMHTMSDDSPSFLVAGAGTKRRMSLPEMLDKEAQYGAEYDAISALALLAPAEEDVSGE